MTDFSNICNILGSIYREYNDDENEFTEFISFNDLGLPMAYFAAEGLSVPTEDGKKYIIETWKMFLDSVGIEDTEIGFSDLSDILDLAEETLG